MAVSVEQSGITRPVLIEHGHVAAPVAVALLLHGGRANSTAATANRQLAVARMAPIAHHLASAGESSELAVFRLRFRYRGWNKTGADAVQDARWAIRRLREQLGDVPVVLVGHSMGGRAAMHVAGETGVTAVVGLAPWLVPGEPQDQVAGRRLLVIHGTLDKTTSPRASRQFVEQVRPRTITAGWIGLTGSGHGLLRKGRLVNQLAAEFVLNAAFGTPLTGPLAQVLAGTGSELVM